MPRFSLLESLTFDHCTFGDDLVAELQRCAAHSTTLTSLRLLRDVINGYVYANARSSDDFLSHFVAHDRLLRFSKSPLDAVSETMRDTLVNWFQHTTCLRSIGFSDHIGNLGLGTPTQAELHSASSLCDAAIRCTTLHALSLDGMWRSLPCDAVFSTVVAAFDTTAAELRSLSFSSTGLDAEKTTQLLQCLSQRFLSTLEDLDISSCRCDADALNALETIVLQHRRLTRLRMLTLRFDTRGSGIVAPLFDMFGRSSALRSIELSRHKNSLSKACALRSVEIDALQRFLLTPSFARLQVLHFGDFPQADAASAAAAAERLRIVAALDRSARLVSVKMAPLISVAMLQHIVTRNKSGAWSQPTIRARVSELCFALATLDLPIYVMLDILDAIDPLSATPATAKISAIEIVKRRHGNQHLTK